MGGNGEPERPSYRSFIEYVDAVESRPKTLRVLNREDYDPVFGLLEKTFDSDDVTVVDDVTEVGTPLDVVQLEDERGIAIASSDLTTVRDTLLLVNSDLYITGTRPLAEIDTPDVVAHLENTTFDVAGKSKFLLIHISRHVEAMALETGAGVLHAGFQELSRVTDERGTFEAYRRLAETTVETHAYGVPDWEHPPEEDIVVHGHRDGEIPKAWFVVHDGGERANRNLDTHPDRRKAALVATETGPNEYRGFWTFEPELVDDVLAYIETTYC